MDRPVQVGSSKSWFPVSYGGDTKSDEESIGLVRAARLRAGRAARGRRAAALNSSSAPSLKNAGIGYVAIDGNKALVGTTGTFCVPDNTPKCFTNNDPAAIFSTKKPFGTLWTQANQSNSENVYSLATCIQVSGHWYLYTPSS